MKHQYKTWVIDELTSWSETFNNNYPDHLEEVIQEEQKSFETIHSLINKLSNDECDKSDYENILFHLWQANAES
jgi:hypothetical protein